MTDEWYLYALAAAAIIVAALSWNVPRAPMWIALQALSFCISGWYHDAGLPYPEVFGVLTNFAVMFALYAYAQLLYELFFWLCFVTMTLIDLLSLTNMLNSHWTLAVGLEAANWLALISIGAAGMADRAGIGRYWVAVLRAGPRGTGAVSRRLNPSRQDMA
jgi:hypothetical protein